MMGWQYPQMFTHEQTGLFAIALNDSLQNLTVLLHCKGKLCGVTQCFLPGSFEHFKQKVVDLYQYVIVRGLNELFVKAQ